MKKITIEIIIASFVFAILCSLCSLCSGMAGMVYAGEVQHSGPMKQHPCCPFNKSNNCKCLDINGIDKPETFKKQVFAGDKIKYYKVLSGLTELDSNLLSTPQDRLSYHSPPKKNLGSTPLFIFNRVLRL